MPGRGPGIHENRPRIIPSGPWMPSDRVRGLKAHGSSPAMTKKSTSIGLTRVCCEALCRHLGPDLVAQSFDQRFNDLLVRLGEPLRGLWRRCRGGLLLGVLDHVEQHLGGAQI